MNDIVEIIDHGEGLESVVFRGPGYQKRKEPVDWRYEIITSCAPPARGVEDGMAMTRAGARRVARIHAAKFRAHPWVVRSVEPDE